MAPHTAPVDSFIPTFFPAARSACRSLTTNMIGSQESACSKFSQEFRQLIPPLTFHSVHCLHLLKLLPLKRTGPARHTEFIIACPRTRLQVARPQLVITAACRNAQFYCRSYKNNRADYNRKIKKQTSDFKAMQQVV